MALWDTDLSSYEDARDAADKGGMACYALVALAALGAVILGFKAGFGTIEGISSMIGAGGEAVIAGIAGFRLRRGKGAFWGMVAMVLLAAEVIAKVATLSIGGMLFQGMLLMVVVNGIRGAWVLRKNRWSDGDEIEIFG